jgi:hypothetical protein
MVQGVIDVLCDGEGCENTLNLLYEPTSRWFMDINSVRDRAREHSWSVALKQGGMVDLCPTCTEKRRKALL